MGITLLCALRIPHLQKAVNMNCDAFVNFDTIYLQNIKEYAILKERRQKDGC
jgi:hypothetical protein